jgi:uncharacterized membrane protein
VSRRSSSLLPAELRRPALAGALLLVASWAFISFTPVFRHWLFGDARYYESWGGWIAAHQVPYRDFNVEYPPGALPTFIAPVFLRKLFDYHGTFYFWLRVEILVFSELAFAATLLALRRLDVTRRRAYAVCCAAGVAPAVLGPIAFFHFDYWPAFLAAAAVTALLYRRGVLACAFAAAGTAAKIYPALLVPLALIELWRRGGTRAVARGVIATVVVLAIAFGPFAVVAPHGLAWFFHRQYDRALEVESVGASFFAVAHAAAGVHLHIVLTSGGSHGIAGSAAKTVGTLLTVLMLAALAAQYVSYFRAPATTERLVAACAAVVTTYIVFSKVFSPQYLVWLAPLVLLIGGRRGLRVSVLLFVILGVTQIFEPYLYTEYFRMNTPWVAYLVFFRNLLVVGLLGLLVWTDPSDRYAEQLDPGRVAGLGRAVDDDALDPHVALRRLEPDG